MPDEVLRPSAGTAVSPWMLTRVIYLAILGGVLPVTWLAFVNSGRLAVADSKRGLIVTVGLFGMVIEFFAVGLLMPDGGAWWKALLPMRIVAALCYYVQYRIQRQPDRLFQLSGREYAVPFGTGNLAMVAIGVFTELMIAVVASS
jgi:hypothetical protein